MPSKLGIVMDPIGSIYYKKDSTLAMLWEAEHRGFEIFYFEQKDLFLREGSAYGFSQLLKVYKNSEKWFALGEKKIIPLADLDIILMRKDPPFDLEYIYTTYILETAERAGVLVVNRPQSLRDINEKMATTQFPECTPATLVARDMSLLREFLSEHKDIVCKPLHSMGGYSVFRVQANDLNANTIFETLTERGTRYAMAQKYISEIMDGDKRILLIQGEPVPFALARIPSHDDFRGNLAVGAKGVTKPLTERDQYICQMVGPVLKEKGLFFVGLDVIGEYLTEINVTSPTGIREIDEQCQLNVSGILFNAISTLLRKS